MNMNLLHIRYYKLLICILFASQHSVYGFDCAPPKDNIQGTKKEEVDMIQQYIKRESHLQQETKKISKTRTLTERIQGGHRCNGSEYIPCQHPHCQNNPKNKNFRLYQRALIGEVASKTSLTRKDLALQGYFDLGKETSRCSECQQRGNGLCPLCTNLESSIGKERLEKSQEEEGYAKWARKYNELCDDTSSKGKNKYKNKK